MTPCEHGMPTPAACVECMYEGNLPPAPKPDEPTVVARFHARYGGDCHACNFPIHEGQRIVSLINGEYRHEACEP